MDNDWVGIGVNSTVKSADSIGTITSLCGSVALNRVSVIVNGLSGTIVVEFLTSSMSVVNKSGTWCS